MRPRIQYIQFQGQCNRFTNWTHHDDSEPEHAFRSTLPPSDPRACPSSLGRSSTPRLPPPRPLPVDLPDLRLLLSSCSFKFPPSRKSQSQSHMQSPQEKKQSQPVSVCPWSAHAHPFGQSPSPFLRDSHALSTSATAAGELFLFGGYVHGSRSPSNDLYVISTRDFSTTLLQTSGDVPSPRFGHRTVLTSTILLVWGGMTNFRDQIMQNQALDDSLHLLNLGTSELLLSRPAPADQNFFPSSITRVDSHRCQWSRARRSLLPYHGVGRFKALRLRWYVPQGVF